MRSISAAGSKWAHRVSVNYCSCFRCDNSFVVRSIFQGLEIFIE